MRRACQLGLLVAVAGCGGGAEPVADVPSSDVVPREQLDSLQERFDALLAEHQASVSDRQRIAELERLLKAAQDDAAITSRQLRQIAASADKYQAESEKLQAEVDELRGRPSADVSFAPRNRTPIQQQRADVIAKLIQERILQKIATPGTVPRAYVLPAFQQLTFDQKQAFMSVCYAYVYELPDGAEALPGKFLWVYDAMTNKRLGSMGRDGLRL